MKKKINSLGALLWARKWLVLGLLVLIVGGFFVVKARLNNKKDEAKTTKASVQNIKQTLQLSGYIDASEKADLHFLSSGKLTWVGVKEGDKIKKWQAIAKMDTTTLEKQLQQDVYAFVDDVRDYTTDLDDYEKNMHPDVLTRIRPIIDRYKFDIDRKVLYNLDSAALNIEIRQHAIKLSSLVSPIEGIVTKLGQPNAGANVSPTDNFQVVNPKSVYFAAIVDETDIKNVFVGQKVELVLDAYNDEVLNALVDRVDFTPSTTRSGGNGYKIVINLPDVNGDVKYRLGMNGTATLLVSEKQNVLAIPMDSVVSRDNKTYVDVLVNGKKESREVNLGIQTDDWAEVESGLSDSDEIVMPK